MGCLDIRLYMESPHLDYERSTWGFFTRQFKTVDFRLNGVLAHAILRGAKPRPSLAEAVYN